MSKYPELVGEVITDAGMSVEFDIFLLAFFLPLLQLKLICIMKSISRMLKLLKGYWRQTFLYLLFNILTVVSSLFSIAMVIPFLRVLFGMDHLVTETVPFELSLSAVQHNFNYLISSLLIDYGTKQTLIIVCSIIVALFLMRNLFSYLSTYFMAPVRNGIVEDMRNNMYRKVLNLPLSYFSNERKGDLMSRMSNDVQEVDNSVMSSIQVLFRDPITILVYLTSLMLMNFKLTLIIIAMLPIIGVVLGNIGKSLRRKSKTSQERLGLLTSMIDETLHGLRIIKAFTSEDVVYKKTADTNRRYTRLMIRIFRRRNLASPLTEFISILVMVVILFLGASMVLDKSSTFSPEAFIAYIMIFSQIIAPAKSFSTAYYGVQKGLASLDRVEELLNADISIHDCENPIDMGEFKKGIRYSDVSFRYETDYVLNNINLSVPKGHTVALVGTSGAGKTTLVDLLPRFFDVTDGEILVDDIPIRKLSIKSLRSLFGIVNQEPILFNDTFFNNIAFGMPDASAEAVENAARVANAHEFIMESSDGYQTSIGERGTKLSGGQRQRISIARAIMKNPPVLILDEATSSLDSENERMVQDALERLMSDRTSLVIAHRLSTIIKADNIVVLSQGKVVEQGKHEELLAMNGHYRRLYDLQMFGK